MTYRRSMLKLALALVLAAPLALASLAFAAEGTATAPTETGKGFAPTAEQYRIPINGCTATVSCPTGSITCIGHSPNGCLKSQTANPAWVACDGIVHFCLVGLP